MSQTIETYTEPIRTTGTYHGPGSEFIGLARDFIRRSVAEFTACDQSILNRMYDRAMRHPLSRLRQELLTDFTYSWRAHPAKFRICLDIYQKRNALTLFEIRLLPCIINDPAWDDAEQRESNLSISNALLSINAKRYHKSQLIYLPSHIVSLHALARRYERCADRSDDSVIADLNVLLSLQPTAEDGEPIRIDTCNGSWRGQIRMLNLKAEEQRAKVIAIRTFVT